MRKGSGIEKAEARAVRENTRGAGNMAILEVRNIEKQFDDTMVLRDVSFTLEEGNALAIIGSSGSGKTTLLRCLNFLETPDQGSIAERAGEGASDETAAFWDGVPVVPSFPAVYCPGKCYLV